MGSESCERRRIVVSWDFLVRSYDGSAPGRECGLLRRDYAMGFGKRQIQRSGRDSDRQQARCNESSVRWAYYCSRPHGIFALIATREVKLYT